MIDLPLLASGRDADVYAIDDRWVLRRYRFPWRAEREAELMRYVRSFGYPLPSVGDVRGRELVLERVRGPTMLVDLLRHPWRILDHAAIVADLHRRLHLIPSPPDTPSLLGPGTSVVHLDLHPQNIVMSDRGPVVIDWTNVARGDEELDVAQTWLVVATSNPPGGPLARAATRAVRGLFLRRLLREFDRSAVAERLPTVAERRLRDPNVLPNEKEAIRRLVSRTATGPK